MFAQVAGISGKVRIEGEDEEGIYTEAQGKAIIEALGLERRNEVHPYLTFQPISSCADSFWPYPVRPWLAVRRSWLEPSCMLS